MIKNIIKSLFIFSGLFLMFMAWQSSAANNLTTKAGTNTLTSHSQANQEKETDHNTISNNSPILILQLVEHPALDATRQGIIHELTKAGIAVNYEIAQNNSALAAQIAQKFISKTPRAVIGIATLSAQALVAANRPASLPVPVLFSSVTDPLAARLVSNLKKHKENVAGVSNFVEPNQQFELFKKILPNLKSLGIIYNPGEPNSVALNESMQKIAETYDINLVFAPANNSVDIPQATRQLLSEVDAIFINNDSTALSAFEAITKIAKTKKIPVFVSDTDMIVQGALAAVGPNQYEIGRQTAKLLLQILAGEKAENMPILFPEQTELYINLKVAKELGIGIPNSIVNEAAHVIK
jgi:putative ABC transport system substrate-binding protein